MSQYDDGLGGGDVFTLLSARYTMARGRTRTYQGAGSTDPTDPNMEQAPDSWPYVQAHISRAPTGLANWVRTPYLALQFCVLDSSLSMALRGSGLRSLASKSLSSVYRLRRPTLDAFVGLAHSHTIAV